MLLRQIRFALLIFISFAQHLFSNPLPSPKAFISEFKFENDNTWILEISFEYSVPYYKQSYDSIFLASSNGISRVKLTYVPDGTKLYVITSDSLESPLTITQKGDCIKLYTYSLHGPNYGLIDSLSFGNYPGHMIEYLQPAYSICRFAYNTFYKDKSPTIGLPNDSAGACGTIKGYIYDKNDILIKTGNFILDNLIILNNDGTYFTSVYARTFVCKYIKSGWYPDHITYNNIDSLFIDLEPDSILEKNIHFKDYVVGVKENMEKQSYDLSVVNYPNPFNSSTNFSAKIPTDYKHKKGFINIYNINGRKIFSILLSNNATYTWDGKNQNGEIVSSGVYYYQLVLDNTVYKNGSMIFLK